MTRKAKNSHPEGSVYELLAYLPKLGVYRHSLDVNELFEIRLGTLSVDLRDWSRLWYHGESNYEPRD